VDAVLGAIGEVKSGVSGSTGRAAKD